MATETPLQLAARYAHVDVINILLAAGFLVDERNALAETALHVAATHGHAGVCSAGWGVRACALNASLNPERRTFARCVRSFARRRLLMYTPARRSRVKQLCTSPSCMAIVMLLCVNRTRRRCACAERYTAATNADRIGDVVRDVACTHIIDRVVCNPPPYRARVRVVRSVMVSCL